MKVRGDGTLPPLAREGQMLYPSGATGPVSAVETPASAAKVACLSVC
eukprot:COSAG03_NODE_24269_length_273_cov_1.183908_1_plen_46_part_10